MTLGESLKRKRQDIGLTQEELAKNVGISRTYYADVEAGRYNPSLKVFKKLAKILDLDVNYLIKNDGKTMK